MRYLGSTMNGLVSITAPAFGWKAITPIGAAIAVGVAAPTPTRVALAGLPWRPAIGAGVGHTDGYGVEINRTRHAEPPTGCPSISTIAAIGTRLTLIALGRRCAPVASGTARARATPAEGYAMEPHARVDRLHHHHRSTATSVTTIPAIATHAAIGSAVSATASVAATTGDTAPQTGIENGRGAQAPKGHHLTPHTTAMPRSTAPNAALARSATTARIQMEGRRILASRAAEAHPCGARGRGQSPNKGAGPTHVHHHPRRHGVALPIVTHLHAIET